MIFLSDLETSGPHWGEISAIEKLNLHLGPPQNVTFLTHIQLNFVGGVQIAAVVWARAFSNCNQSPSNRKCGYPLSEQCQPPARENPKLAFRNA